jgi:hypothetical protein
MKNLLWFLLLGGLLVIGCAEDCEDFMNPDCPNYCVDITNPNCPNYDPCYGVAATSAEFESYTFVGTYDELKIVADTFRYNNTVTFRTKEEEGKTYEWKIGNDGRTWNTSSVSLRFVENDSISLRLGIPVQLIVRKTPNTACFPNDDGIDTLQKTIYFRNEWESAFFGKWRGTNTADPDSVYIIEILMKKGRPSGNYLDSRTHIAAYNFRNGGQACTPPHELDASTTHHGLFGVGQPYPRPFNTCPPPYTWWLYSLNLRTQRDSIFIDWLVGEQRVPVSFKGIRVQ